MYSFIIPIAMVAIGIIITVVGASRQTKEAKKKADAERAMNLLDEKDEFKKFLNYDSSSEKSRSQQRPQQVSTAQPQRPQQTPSTTYRSQPTQPAQNSKQQMTAQLQQRLVELKRIQAEKDASKQVVGASHHDSHCDTSHKDSNDKYRVEYVPTMNSIGGKSTEGCQDHYNVRYVKLDEVDETELELTPLQKAIVYGEVINQPAFKRQYRGAKR